MKELFCHLEWLKGGGQNTHYLKRNYLLKKKLKKLTLSQKIWC